MFNLRFPLADVHHWSSRYSYGDDEHLLTKIIPDVKKRGYFMKEEFIYLGEWKSKRPRRHYLDNTPEDVKSITKLALTTKSERLRISVPDSITWR